MPREAGSGPGRKEKGKGRPRAAGGGERPGAESGRGVGALLGKVPRRKAAGEAEERRVRRRVGRVETLNCSGEGNRSALPP